MKTSRQGQRPESRIVTGIGAEKSAPARVARRFRGLVSGGARLLPAGTARRDPDILLGARYVPRYEIRLFEAVYFLTDNRFDEALGFLVGYVMLGEGNGKPVRRIYPRIFYKDSSLVWRAASHFIHDEEEYWIGKGDVRSERRADGEYLCSVEETTNLPYEIQAALDDVSRRRRRRRDDDAIELVLRQAPTGRVEPYADFTAPRRRAAKINGGRRVARFLRAGDPSSLRFTRGFEPDFRAGVLELAVSASRFFGGELRKYRILSTNKQIQYQFIATPTRAWVNPAQALTTEISPFGVRTVDVLADDDLYVPAFEYHEPDEDHESPGPSQIPAGFAGDPHPDDPARADASAWVEALPVIREFRRRVLGVARG